LENLEISLKNYIIRLIKSITKLKLNLKSLKINF